MTSSNLLAETADRFNRQLEKAWAKHPPPCQREPAILPCDAGKPCPVQICLKTCNYRSRLKEALELIKYSESVVQT